MEWSKTWAGLAAFVRVIRTGQRQGNSFHHQSWFILSQMIPASQAAQLIQQHRATIENQLHWVKDVVFDEDTSLICALRPALLLSLWRTWAISAFRRAGYQSVTQALRLFKHDLPSLFSFL